jgi:hypothetical protein
MFDRSEVLRESRNVRVVYNTATFVGGERRSLDRRDKMMKREGWGPLLDETRRGRPLGDLTAQTSLFGALHNDRSLSDFIYKGLERGSIYETSDNKAENTGRVVY